MNWLYWQPCELKVQKSSWLKACQVFPHTSNELTINKGFNVNKLLPKIVLGALVIGATYTAFAADPKPEDEVKYRQSVFNVIGRNCGLLGTFVKGEKPFDQAAAVKAANVVASLSTLPFGSFGPGTDVGTHKSDPKIWTETGKFKEAADNFKSEVSKLPASANSLDTLKVQFGAVAKTCKSCHDEFRVKDKK
jgi:cytochrome c556